MWWHRIQRFAIIIFVEVSGQTIFYDVYNGFVLNIIIATLNTNHNLLCLKLLWAYNILSTKWNERKSLYD